MSKENKTVIVDIDGAIAILRARGIEVGNKTNLGIKYNLTNATMLNWQKQANQAIRFIHDFCNDTGLTFDELVREVTPKYLQYKGAYHDYLKKHHENKDNTLPKSFEEMFGGDELVK